MTLKTQFSQSDIQIIISNLKASYWAQDRTDEQFRESLKNSFCYGLYDQEKLVAFGRVISDVSTFSYLCDVFVVEEERGKGWSKKLMEEILNDGRFAQTNWLLRTKDAHGLYEQFGFEKTHRPERYMEKKASAKGL